MRRPIALLFCLLMITMPLSGCIGGDDDDSSNTPDEELSDWSVHFASSASDLPECDSDIMGRIYYVESDGEFQACTPAGWQKIDISGPQGLAGQQGESASFEEGCYNTHTGLKLTEEFKDTLQGSENLDMKSLCEGYVWEFEEGDDTGDAGSCLNELTGEVFTNDSYGEDLIISIKSQCQSIEPMYNWYPSGEGDGEDGGEEWLFDGLCQSWYLVDGVWQSQEIWTNGINEEYCNSFKWVEEEDPGYWECRNYANFDGGTVNGPIYAFVTMERETCNSFKWQEGSSQTAPMNGVNGITPLITTTYSTNCPSGGNTFKIGMDFDTNSILDDFEVMTTLDICNGMSGKDGRNGEDGDKGDTGDTGIQGPIGPPGSDGNDGATGAPGADGNDGSDGQPGIDGTDGQDGATGAPGADGSDGADGNDGATGAPGADGSDGADGNDGATGAPGADGNDGHSVLISTSTEPAGANCANGGVKIEAGTDDNDDGTLQATEVDSTQYICDGGSSASTMLSTASPLPGTMVCSGGGNVISHGLDNGDGGGTAANGQLESGEVDYSITYCNTKGTVVEYNCTGCYAGSSYPSNMLAIGTDIFMQYYGNGYELYKYDTTMPGSSSNPSLVKNMNSGSHGNPQELTAMGSSFFFKARAKDASGSSLGYEFWVSDGTTSGTVLVKDIRPGAAGSMDANPFFTVFNNELYFSATDGINGHELWKSDGTTSGTNMVADIRTGSTSSSPQYLTVFNNELYFWATDGTNGTELWKYDGTNAPSMAADIRAGSGGSYPAYLTVFNNELYFKATDGTNGYELWKYDGTTTSMVADIYTGSSSGSPADLTVFNNELYFSATDGTNGNELWKYDGVNAPSMVADIYTGSSSGSPADLTVFNNELYFQADDGTHGQELWKYDGLGVSMVLDISPGSADGVPDDGMVIVGNALYFAGDDGFNGEDLWSTDGTGLGYTVVTYS